MEVPVDDVDPSNLATLDIPIGGYTLRLAPSPGIYWAAWVEEGAPYQQKIRQRYLAK